MDRQLPSVSSKSRKKNCKCSKGRSIPLFTVWSSKAGLKRNGGSTKPAARQRSTPSRAQGESTWRKRKRTGTACLGQLISLFVRRETSFCKTDQKRNTRTTVFVDCLSPMPTNLYEGDDMVKQTINGTFRQ